MHDLRERAAGAGVDVFLCGLTSPLPQELSLTIEYSHAAIPVSVRDIDITVAGIDDETCGVEELRRACVQILSFRSAVRTVEDTALANLHQKFAVVRPLLNDAV